MIKYSARIRTIGNKTCEWLKAQGRVLAGLAMLLILAFLVLIIFSQESLKLDAKIQAALMAALILITIYYAYQTHRLVKEERRALDEEKKKRYAEFGEKRIEKFLRPLLQKLEDLNDSLSVITESRNRPLIDGFENSLGMFQARLNKIDELFSEYLFMASDRLRGDLQEFLREVKKSIPTFENQAESYTIPWKKEIEKDISELMSGVNIEISIICQEIRITYGYYSHGTDILKSWDDLAVLSDRPPKRI